LSLAHALKKAEPQCQIIYIGLKGDLLENRLQQRYKIFDEVCSVTSGKFRRYNGQSLLAHLVDLRTLALNVVDFFKVIIGIFEAKKIIKKVRPSIVFSKGGYASVPVGIAASIYKIPIITHDSDTVPGLANRVVGRFAKIHATGMPAAYYSYPPETIHYVGIPVDERIKPVTLSMQQSFKKQLGIPVKAQLLLVGGAGLGARDVNNMILAIAGDLLGDFKDLYIIHVAGNKHQADVENQYKEVAGDNVNRVTVLGFTPDFYEYTGAADVVVTRAGATTIAELSVQRKPAVLIPAPHLTGGHQVKNAKELQAHNSALIVNNDANPNVLSGAIKKVLSNKTEAQKLSKNIGRLAKMDAADKLAEIIIETARGKVG